jgi:RimJ/RimL family protein N-acetyltransferase
MIPSRTSTRTVDRTVPTIRLVPVDDRLHSELEQLRVHPHQEPFVSNFAVLHRRIERTPWDQRRKLPFGILAAGEGQEPPGTAVGFVLLSPFHPAVSYYCRDESEVGIENLLIDRRYQGRGYGVAALRAAIVHVRERFPEARRAKLTVNTRNRSAIEIYVRLGFEDTGELYLGGRSGPQHVYGIQLRD